VSALPIDGDTRAFLEASVGLVAFTGRTEANLLAACKGIDQDLGVPDTWTAKAATDGGAPDDEVTEACTRAANKMQTVIAAHPEAWCVLHVSGAHCAVDEGAQANCESSCSGSPSCDAGSITTLCPSDALAGQCGGACSAGAVCEGTAQNPAACAGACTAECTGLCDSRPSDARYCNGTCVGTCAGDCQVATGAQVRCGPDVRCLGGCNGAYTALACETTVTPPACDVSPVCAASCRSEVETASSCSVPDAILECNLGANTSEDTAWPTAPGENPDASTIQAVIAPELPPGLQPPPDLTALLGTVKRNLPTVLVLAQSRGQLALDAADEAVSTGRAIAGDTARLDGKALACAFVASQADVKASDSLRLAIKMSWDVSGSCGGPTAQPPTSAGERDASSSPLPP
jgi:hypothetical protein